MEQVTSSQTQMITGTATVKETQYVDQTTATVTGTSTATATATSTDPGDDYRGSAFATPVETIDGVGIYEVEEVVEVEVVVSPETTVQVAQEVDVAVATQIAVEVLVTEEVETTEDITVMIPVDIQVEQTTVSTATRTADGS